MRSTLRALVEVFLQNDLLPDRGVVRGGAAEVCPIEATDNPAGNPREDTDNPQV